MTTEISQKRSSDATTETTLIHEAADLLNACLDSIPRKKVNPMKFWDWAQKALELGARKGRTYEQMVSEMHAALPINGAFRKKSSSKIYSIGSSVNAIGYAQFRRVCRKNAAYIVAFTQMIRDDRKHDETSEWLDDPNDNPKEAS